MVTGYNLKIEMDNCKFQEYAEIGETHLKLQKSRAEELLKKYINNGIADGTQIEKDWFPQIEADVFILYSHKDETLAKELISRLVEV